jgi:hypothetical protein
MSGEGPSNQFPFSLSRYVATTRGIHKILILTFLRHMNGQATSFSIGFPGG